MDPALEPGAGGPSRARRGDRSRGGAPQPTRREPPGHEPDRGGRPAGAPRAVRARGPRRDDAGADGGAPRGTPGHRLDVARICRRWRWTPVFIDQVLTNLLENAARYAPADAPIRVRAEEAAEGTVRLTVEDGGPGVPPAALPRLVREVLAGARAGEGARGGGGHRAGSGPRARRGDGRARQRRAPSELGGLAVDVDLRAARSASIAGRGRARQDATVIRESPSGALILLVEDDAATRREVAALPRAARLPGRRGRRRGGGARALGWPATRPRRPRPRPPGRRRLGRDPPRAARCGHADRRPVRARPGGRRRSRRSRQGADDYRDEAIRRGASSRPAPGRPPTRGGPGRGPRRASPRRRPGRSTLRATR